MGKNEYLIFHNRKRYFIKKLRFFRGKKELTQKQLSMRIGKREGYIGEVENGMTDLTVSAFLRLCYILDVAPSAFFEEEMRSGN